MVAAMRTQSCTPTSKRTGNRLALLAVLYGWTQADDHQYLYRNVRPNLVYSVDHGDFFPGQGGWSRVTLEAAGAAEPDAAICVPCGLTTEELRPAAERLIAIGPEEIATAVALPPDEWDISLEDRIALAQFLTRRKNDLLNQLHAV